MAQLYSNAYIVLAASAAPDSTHSLFHRSKPRYVIINVSKVGSLNKGHFYAFGLHKVLACDGWHYLQMYREPLTHRAWALQVRALPRRILHYASDQMFFECVQHFISEDDFRYDGRYLQLFEDIIRPPAIHESNVPIRSAHNLWHDILRNYGGRAASHATDKLPAIAGLARFFEGMIGAKYLAGHWSDNLIQNLCWSNAEYGDPRPLGARTQYIAPSWSWASNDGSVYVDNNNGENLEELSVILNYHVELKTSNHYGEVSSGCIRLHGPLLPLILGEQPWDDVDKLLGPRAARLCMQRSSTYESRAYFDRTRCWRAQSGDWGQEQELHALLLQKRKAGAEGDPCYFALVVASMPNEMADADGLRVKRLGWIKIEASDVPDPELWAKTVTLI